MSLMENQMKQDKHFRDVALENIPECKFSVFLGMRPRLFDAVDLDTGTINYIKDYFWEYNVNPAHFEHHFITKLKRVCAVYNNMKAIEFHDKVFDITTDKYVRQLITEATNELARTGGKNAKTKNTGTIKDTSSEHEDGSNSITYGKTESETISKNIDTANDGFDITTADTNRKQAVKNLPMQTGHVNMSPNQDLDWEKGASGVQQNKAHDTNRVDFNSGTHTEEDNTVTNRASGTDRGTNNSSRTGSNDRVIDTEVNYEDATTLRDLGSNAGEDNETLEITRGQGVELIQKIWNYLLAPKALDYLVEELQTCFILVY